MPDTHVPPLEDRPPENDPITPYDEMHFTTYIRFLDAEADGVDWCETVCIVFGLDPDQGAAPVRSTIATWRALAE